MIAAEQGAVAGHGKVLGYGEAQVIGGMSGRVDGFQRKPRACINIAIGHHVIGRIIHVMTGVETP